MCFHCLLWLRQCLSSLRSARRRASSSERLSKTTGEAQTMIGAGMRDFRDSRDSRDSAESTRKKAAGTREEVERIKRGSGRPSKTTTGRAQVNDKQAQLALAEDTQNPRRPAPIGIFGSSACRPAHTADLPPGAGR